MDIADTNIILAEVKAIPLEVLNLASLAVSEVFKKITIYSNLTSDHN